MDMEVPENLTEWGIHKALKKQYRIGWNNFMKGRISPDFSTVYEQDDKMETIPNHFSATWWTAGLIKEIIYLSLNVGQRQNSFLHEHDTMTQEVRDCTEALQLRHD